MAIVKLRFNTKPTAIQWAITNTKKGDMSQLPLSGQFATAAIIKYKIKPLTYKRKVPMPNMVGSKIKGFFISAKFFEFLNRYPEFNLARK